MYSRETDQCILGRNDGIPVTEIIVRRLKLGAVAKL